MDGHVAALLAMTNKAHCLGHPRIRGGPAAPRAADRRSFRNTFSRARSARPTPEIVGLDSDCRFTAIPRKGQRDGPVAPLLALTHPAVALGSEVGRPLRGRRIGWSSRDALSRAPSARPTPERPDAAIPRKGQRDGPVAPLVALTHPAVALGSAVGRPLRGRRIGGRRVTH